MGDPLVDTKYGRLRGTADDGVRCWRGIPYAESGRFAPPVRSEFWTGVRDAVAYGPSAPQPPDLVMSQLMGRASVDQSEGCLSLNIWAPDADGPLRPVMVWLHGGAFVTGSGAVPWYDGSSFVRNGDVVVVTLNYRLGPLGFLYLGELFGPEFADSGNLGILDQIAALRWVRENIEAFGGDPDRVTVFGESAGAASIGVLLATPAARGLFRQAIMQSGCGTLLLQTRADASAVARRILRAAGVPVGDLQALRTIEPRMLVDAGASLGLGLAFGPVVDGRVIPENPISTLERGAAKDIPILIGVNRDEFRLFSLADPTWRTGDEAALTQLVHQWFPAAPDPVLEYYRAGHSAPSVRDRFLALGTYASFVDGMLRTADAQAEHDAPVWTYRFDIGSPAFGGILGSCHALEIPFVFDHLDLPGTDRFTGSGHDVERVAKQMHQAWIGFARRTDPDHADMPHWPRYDAAKRTTMVFGRSSCAEEDLWGAERRVWARGSTTMR